MFQRLKKAIARRLSLIFGIGYGHMGTKSCIYKPISIIGKNYICLGNYCNIGEGARIECIDSWGKNKYTPSIEIGNNTTIENFLHMTSAGNIKIGHDCVFLSRVMITNIDHDYSDINIKVMQQDLIINDVEIGDYCFLGMDVKVFPGVKIGENVIVGANSIVMHDLPSYTVCVGIPAKPIKNYNFTTKCWERV